jgi:SH3 domain-containing YSC84-like protein 1
MRNRAIVAVLALSGLVVSSASLRADDERLKTAALVITEMAGTADNAIPLGLFQKAKCVVVVPGVKKAALGFGGQYGRGYMLCRDDSARGWTAPGGIRVEGGSVGFQIGGAETDVILLVMNERGMGRLLSSKFTVGADASVAAGPVGRQASAQTDATMTAEILAWSRARGAFAGVSLQGSTLREDGGENKELYGADITNVTLMKGTVPPPPAADALIAALAKVK